MCALRMWRAHGENLKKEQTRKDEGMKNESMKMRMSNEMDRSVGRLQTP